MKATIIDILPEATCAASRRKNVECYVVLLNDDKETTITPNELQKSLRLQKALEHKSNAPLPRKSQETAMHSKDAGL